MSETTENIITVNNLVKTFKDFTAVDHISFQVKKGEIFAFLGPNGAGKSTTIKMLTTLLTPASGEILIDGFNPVSQKNEARKSFGIVFQDPSLDGDMSAYENMVLHAIMYKVPKSTRQARINELLKFVDLADRRDSMVKTFSGGMKRRLEIARGLLHHPRILFLDEPTLGLDPQTRNHLWNYLREVNKNEGMTVFFTTHYMEEAERIADKIAIIDKGKIIASGTGESLKKETGTESLEQAFLALTGSEIREEEASGLDRMRAMGKMMGGRR